MEIKVLTCESEQKSAEKLGFKTHTYLGDYVNKYNNNIVIRWGNSKSAFGDNGRREFEFKQVINPANKIRRNCQKNIAIKLMAQVVNVPTIYEKTIPKDTLAVVRPLEHAAGNGFSVKKGPFKIEPGTYGTKFIKTDTEYRVWFCGDKTMCGRRVKMKVNETQEYACRSNWGYEFSTGIAPELHYQTLLAAKKIGLDFGAADLLYYKGKYWFLELNSAPSVDHRIVREFYQQGLQILMAKKFPEMFGIQKKEQAPVQSPEPKKSERAQKPVAMVEIVPPAVPPVTIPPGTTFFFGDGELTEITME